MQIIIDRIEDNQAIVELPDMNTINASVSLFPGAKEGDVYNIFKDENEAVKRKKRIQDKFNMLRSERL